LKDELEELEGMFTGFSDDELRSLFEEVEEEEEPAEVEFTEEIGEKNNYLVLFFDNELDWLQAETIFDLKTVKALDSKKNYTKKGVGRVLNGADAIKKIMDKRE